ncbi:MAG: hypothetical protein RL685_6957 [Pseudomonadota bacterium]|jgi:hypothetical protein
MASSERFRRILPGRWLLTAGALALLGVWACLNPETDDFPTFEGSDGSGEPTGVAPGSGSGGSGGSGALGGGAGSSATGSGASNAGSGAAGEAGAGGVPPAAPAGGEEPDGGVADAGERVGDGG